MVEMQKGSYIISVMRPHTPPAFLFLFSGEIPLQPWLYRSAEGFRKRTYKDPE